MITPLLVGWDSTSSSLVSAASSANSRLRPPPATTGWISNVSSSSRPWSNSQRTSDGLPPVPIVPHFCWRSSATKSATEPLISALFDHWSTESSVLEATYLGVWLIQLANGSSVGGGAVLLALHRLQGRGRQQLGQGAGRGDQPWLGAGAVHDQDGDGDRGPAIAGQGGTRHGGSHDPPVVGDRVRDRFESGPERALSHAGHGLGRHARRHGEEQLHGVTRPAAGNGVVEPLHVVGRPGRAAVVDDERWFEQRQPADRETGRCGVEGQHRAGGPPENHSRCTGVVDQGGKVLDLALHRIRRGVGALAAAATVVDVDPKLLTQQLPHLCVREVDAAIGGGAIDHDQRLAVAPDVERDRGAVLGADRSHRGSSSFGSRWHKVHSLVVWSLDRLGQVAFLAGLRCRRGGPDG